METKNKCVRVSFSAILYGVLAISVSVVPCAGAYVPVDGTNSPYVLDTVVAHYLDVAGTDPIYFPNGPGTLEFRPGGYTSAIYVNVGGTLKIYGCAGDGTDDPVQIAGPANVTVFTDDAATIQLTTASGPDAQFDGATISVDPTNGWTGKLTWTYENVSYHLNICTFSDIVVEVVSGPTPAPIDIDIKPGSYPNTINLGSNGVVPVAILSTEGFDATALDPTTVFLAGSGVAVRGKGKSLAHEEDVNADGWMDLVVQVETENLDPGTFQDGGAVLQVKDGGTVLYEGWDEITIVPPE
jgi:hypothetical protein